MLVTCFASILGMSLSKRIILFSIVSASRSLSFGFDSGYTNDVESEKNLSFQEVFVYSAPTIGPKSVHGIIFDQKLSKEFREKYQYEFGQVDAESLSYQTTKYYTQDQNRALLNTSEEENEKRKQFAQFMTKRLSEHHLDIYMRTEPSLRPVYDVKEKLKNVEVKVSNSVKLNSRYSFSGNTLDLVFDNPWIDAEIRLEMDPEQFAPTSPQEYQVQLSGKIGHNEHLTSRTRANEGITFLELSKNWTHNISTTLAGSTFIKNNTPEEKRENRISFAFSNSF